MTAVHLWLIAAALAIHTDGLWGCDVPVFRFALERWLPDTYEAVVYHAGSTPPSLLVAPHEPSARDALARPAANLRILFVDTTGPLSPADKALLAEHEDDRFPVMILTAPGPQGRMEALWHGGATPGILDSVLHSPARNEIARRILSGKSAVFVLVESGVPGRDQDASDLIRKTLAEMPRALSLPALTVDSAADPVARAVPRIEFSLLRIARSGASEAHLIRMLLATEGDLASSQGPILFPVFGRGRVLHALVGDGISHTNIRIACAFLVGPCACEIKAQNPGADLLMAVNWAGRLREQIVDTDALDAIAAASQYLELSDPRQTLDSPVAPQEGPGDTPQNGTLVRNLAIALVASLSVVAAISAVLWTRK